MMRTIIIRTSTIIFIFAALEAVVRVGFVNRLILSPPTEILSALKSLVASGRLWSHLGITSLEVLVAALISIPSGILTGLLLAKYLFFGKFFGSFVYFLVSVPKSIFLPIFILMLGVDFEQKVAFGIAQAFLLSQLILQRLRPMFLKHGLF
jgi:NitT/TauT family transport system permease protein